MAAGAMIPVPPAHCSTQPGDLLQKPANSGLAGQRDRWTGLPGAGPAWDTQRGAFRCSVPATLGCQRGEGGRGPQGASGHLEGRPRPSPLGPMTPQEVKVSILCQGWNSDIRFSMLGWGVGVEELLREGGRERWGGAGGGGRAPQKAWPASGPPLPTPAWSALATGHPETFSSLLEASLSHVGAGLGALKIASRWGQAGSYY